MVGGCRPPIYADNAALDELEAAFGRKPSSKFLAFMSDDERNKCGQERDLGRKCDPK